MYIIIFYRIKLRKMESGMTTNSLRREMMKRLRKLQKKKMKKCLLSPMYKELTSSSPKLQEGQ